MKNTTALQTLQNAFPFIQIAGEAAPKTAQPNKTKHVKSATITLINQTVLCNHKHMPEPMNFAKIHEDAFLNRYDAAYFCCPKCQSVKRAYWRFSIFGSTEELVVEKC